MKKKIAAVVAIWSVYICFLQFGRDMDVVNSLSFSYANFLEEDIRVKRVLDNGFHTIKFDLNRGYSNKLKVSVYKDKKSIGSGDMLFSFTYGQSSDHGEIGAYDISQADYMELQICDR